MINYLTVIDVMFLHDMFLEKFGGLPGVRDFGLLSSAVEIPKSQMFGEDLYPNIYDKASAYLFHVVSNHPFNDGNKRTGFGATLLFLKLNSARISFKGNAFENLVVEVAQGKVTKREIAHFLEKGC